MFKELKRLMDSMAIVWCVCGGHAIDLFVGQQTRLHKDVDLAVLWEDRSKIITEFIRRGWRVFEPNHGFLREITSCTDDKMIEDNLWCLRPDAGYEIIHQFGNYYKISTARTSQTALDFIEVLFNRVNNGAFLYKRNPQISLTRYLYVSKNGIPYLAPEMILLYKSTFVRLLGTVTPEHTEVVKNYRHDFRVARARLSVEQKKWLKDALQEEYPKGHEWIELL